MRSLAERPALHPRPTLATPRPARTGAARPACPARPARPSPPAAILPHPSALATDAAYLGLSATAIAAAGLPLLPYRGRPGGPAPALDLATADATRATPRPAFILLTLVSFLPLVNFAAWLLLMVTEGRRPRYWAAAALYAAPLLAAVAGGGEALALEGAALCAVHFQVERLALAVLDARAAAGAGAMGEAISEDDEAVAVASLEAAAGEELASFDARLGARLARGPRLRALAAAVGVPRARSARVGEVAAGLEAVVSVEAGEGEVGHVREALIEEAQAALAGKGRRRLKQEKK